MTKRFSLKTLAYILIILSGLLTIWFLLYGDFLGGDFKNPDLNKIKNLQLFFAGIFVPLITFGTSLLIIETFKNTSLQNISNNFFKLIDQNKKILENLNCATSELPDGYIKNKGKDFFDDLAEFIAMDFNALKYNDTNYLSKMDKLLIENVGDKKGKEMLIALYDHYFHIYQSELGHYFRSLYYIVKYIDNCKIRKDEKIEFLKILRSQLSNYELLILAYNGLHSYGKEFYKYIESYELLKSLNNEMKLPASYQKRIIDLEILKLEYPHLEKYWNIKNTQ